jgi:hypothetical protein
MDERAEEGWFSGYKAFPNFWQKVLRERYGVGE